MEPTEDIVACTYYKFNPHERSSYPSFLKILQPENCPDRPSDPFFADQETPFPTWVDDALTPLTQLCEQYDCKVLLADLSLIQEQRWLPPGAQPYLVNSIVCYHELEAAAVVLQAYRDALHDMQTDPSLREPIVPHPHFARSFCLLTPLGAQAISPHLTSQPIKVPKHSAFHQRYPYTPGPGDHSIDTLIQALLGAFLTHLNSRHTGASIIFKNAWSLALPFSRAPSDRSRPTPEYPVISEALTPAALQSLRPALPGGGLFILLVPHDPATWRKRCALACAQALQYQLSQAALMESVTSLDLELERTRSVARLQNLAFGFGHDLKNRLAESSFLILLERLRDNAPVEPAALKACLEKLELLYGIVEILRVGDKLAAGVFPREWARRELVDTWPEKFEASHLQQAAAACRTAIQQGVAPYFRPLLDQGRHCCLREVDSSQGVWEVPLAEQGLGELPPLSGWVARRGSPAPVLAVLAGLAEIVRNAARAIADNAAEIETRYQKVHLDYQVGIGEDYVRVTVWNPYPGYSQPRSPSLGRLHAMYQALTAIEIDPEITPVDCYHYAYTPAAPGYAQATFTWWPKKLRFA